MQSRCCDDNESFIAESHGGKLDMLNVTGVRRSGRTTLIAASIIVVLLDVNVSKCRETSSAPAPSSLLSS